MIEVLASTDIPEPSSSPNLRHRVNNWLPSNQSQETNVGKENPHPPLSFPNFKINNQSHNPEVTKILKLYENDFSCVLISYNK